MKSVSIRTEKVNKSYATHRALTDVSIDVEAGTVYGLLGPNGAGKTSLIRIINQITAPDSGLVLLDNRPLRPEDTELIGYLPEERGLYKKMKVGEQMLYLARLKGLSKSEANKRLKEWFDRFDISAWWDKKVEELSKGMAQKVQFIGTVLHNPGLLILDEPFSGFDPVNAQIVKDEILRLKSEGTTVILSTHNMTSVEEICDKIALINRSRKVLEGKVRDIRNSHKSDRIEIVFRGNLIGFTNALWANFELLDSETLDDVHSVVVRTLRQSTVNRLVESTLPHIELISVKEVIPGMHDIFVQSVTENKEEIHG
jgi:ABC-2 type transport system ATP-binding protein